MTNSSAAINAGSKPNTNGYKTHVLGILFLTLSIASLSLLPLLPGTIAQQSKNELPFLQNISEPYVLAYMGYPGCSDVCPISLGTLGNTYRDIASQVGTVPVKLMFVNIEVGMPESVSLNYAKQFHPEFSAYSVKAEESKTFYQSLSLKTYKKTEDPSSHTDFIYLFKQSEGQWNLDQVYFEPPSVAALTSRILAGPSAVNAHKEI